VVFHRALFNKPAGAGNFLQLFKVEQQSHLCCAKKFSVQYIIIVKVSGSFRLAVKISHLHEKFNFTEFMLETARESLRHSCRTPIKCQGILLP